MDGYVTKTTDPVKRERLNCIRDLCEVSRKANELAVANAFQGELPGIGRKLKRINDIQWELWHEVSDLLVYKKVDE